MAYIISSYNFAFVFSQDEIYIQANTCTLLEKSTEFTEIVYHHNQLWDYFKQQNILCCSSATCSSSSPFLDYSNVLIININLFCF